jgi:hypothetical protein
MTNYNIRLWFFWFVYLDVTFEAFWEENMEDNLNYDLNQLNNLHHNIVDEGFLLAASSYEGFEDLF